MAEEINIDNTVNGTGLFNTKIPGLSDAADIQAALRLYHYGSYAYDGANTDTGLLLTPSIAKHLQNLVDMDATKAPLANPEFTTGITTPNNTASRISFYYPDLASFPEASDAHGAIAHAHDTGKLYFAHAGQWLILSSEDYVDTEIENSIVDQSLLAGVGIDWNTDTDQFDVEPQIANTGTVITKGTSFTLEIGDVEKTILLNTSSPMILTVPANSSVEIPIGYKYNFIEVGSGRTTFSPSAGVIVGSKNSQLFLDGQYSKGTLVKIGTDAWVLYGDVYEGVATPTPTPTTPTPTTPTPTTPTPTTPTPTPTPTTPTPTAPPFFPPDFPPTPTTPTPTAPPFFPPDFPPTPTPTPTTPTPTTPTPTTPTPTTPTPTTPTPTTPTPTTPTPTTPTPTTPTPTPTPVGTTYWYTGCCNGNQVTGTSSIDFDGAFSAMNLLCESDPTNQQSGVYTTTSNIPVITCPVGPAPTPTTPTPTTPTPTTPTPTTPTPTTPTPTSCCTGLTKLAVGTNATQFCVGNYGSGYTWSQTCTEGNQICGTCVPPAPTPTPTTPTPTTPTPTTPTPTTPTPTTPTPTTPTPTTPTPTAAPITCPQPGSWSGWSTCSGGTQTRTRTNYTLVGSGANAFCEPYIEEQSQSCTPTPTPTTPTPTTPTPTTPTPTTPTPTTPTPTTPTPTTPTPTTPTPTTPTPTTPTPTTPTPTTPTPTAAPSPGKTCTSANISMGICTGGGCDNSGCATGATCSNAQNFAGSGC